MSHPVHDCKKFYWVTEWVPAELVVRGDQPFVRGLIGVSISPMVGSIYNMGVWDKVAVAWVKAGVRRTLECVWWSGAWSSYESFIVAWPWAASKWPSLRPAQGTFPRTTPWPCNACSTGLAPA